VGILGGAYGASGRAGRVPTVVVKLSIALITILLSIAEEGQDHRTLPARCCPTAYAFGLVERLKRASRASGYMRGVGTVPPPLQHRDRNELAVVAAVHLRGLLGTKGSPSSPCVSAEFPHFSSGR
jgi:hypothetical protein